MTLEFMRFDAEKRVILAEKDDVERVYINFIEILREQKKRNMWMKWVVLTKVKKLLPDQATLQERYAIADRIL